MTNLRGFPGGASGKEPASQCRRHKKRGFNPWVGKIPWRRAWQSTPVFLPRESPWTEEPGRLQSIRSQRVGPNWSDLAHTRAGQTNSWCYIQPWKAESISSKIRDKTSMPILTTLFNIVLKVLATAIREKEEREPKLEKKKLNCQCLQMTWYYT